MEPACRTADTSGMSTIPERLAEVVPWCEVHVAAWETDPAAIGLDEQTVSGLDALTREAEAAERAYAQAKQAADAALLRARQRTGALRTRVSQAVGRVRAFAATQDQPARVLAEAQLPVRRDASPMPAPGMPTRFEFKLLRDGSLEVAFKCDNTAEGGRRLRGVTYEVRRSDGLDGTLAYVCTALERRFRDETIPKGTASVTYQITAQTSTRRGDPAVVRVSFGSGGVQEGAPERRAA